MGLPFRSARRGMNHGSRHETGDCGGGGVHRSRGLVSGFGWRCGCEGAIPRLRRDPQGGCGQAGRAGEVDHASRTAASAFSASGGRSSDRRTDDSAGHRPAAPVAGALAFGSDSGIGAADRDGVVAVGVARPDAQSGSPAATRADGLDGPCWAGCRGYGDSSAGDYRYAFRGSGDHSGHSAGRRDGRSGSASAGSTRG